MLNKETLDYVKTKIKEINKEKDIDKRVDLMIEVKDDIRNKMNDELDDLFASINLKHSKLNIDEE